MVYVIWFFDDVRGGGDVAIIFDVYLGFQFELYAAVGFRYQRGRL